MKAQAYQSRRHTLGDKLHYLAYLSEDDVRDIERIVDYRIQTRCQQEYDHIRAISKRPAPLPFKR